MVLVKANKGKAKLIDKLVHVRSIIFQYTKSKDLITLCDFIAPSTMPENILIDCIIENTKRPNDEVDTIIIYTDRTETEIQKLKELLAPYDNDYFIIITCVED